MRRVLGHLQAGQHEVQTQTIRPHHCAVFDGNEREELRLAERLEEHTPELGGHVGSVKQFWPRRVVDSAHTWTVLIGSTSQRFGQFLRLDA